MKPQATLSLPNVHGSISTSVPSGWKRKFAFAWATALEGGARFGYKLRTLSARLGVVFRQDLAG